MDHGWPVWTLSRAAPGKNGLNFCHLHHSRFQLSVARFHLRRHLSRFPPLRRLSLELDLALLADALFQPRRHFESSQES